MPSYTYLRYDRQHNQWVVVWKTATMPAPAFWTYSRLDDAHSAMLRLKLPIGNPRKEAVIV